jgi:5-methylcytosine-specific restriction endonuclease McrA
LETKPGNRLSLSTKNKHLAATIAVAVCKHFMNDILNKSMVLVLNRNWQAVNVRTPQESFCMMATNVATGLEIEGEHHIRPVTWDEWITLAIRPQDNAVQTVRGPIRVPTVIVAVNYAKVPKKRPKLCARAIRERGGNRCQYTGRVLRPDEGSLDHVVPRSRGGKNAWENLVWAGKEVERPQGQPPATRGRPEAVECAKRAEGIAGLGAHPQCPRYSGVEAVRAGIRNKTAWRAGVKLALRPIHK